MKRNLIIAGFGTGAVLILSSLHIAAQQPAKAPAAVPASPAASAKPATASAKPAAPAYKQPMTSWGEPDISGLWPLNNLVSTNLERNANLGEKLYLTEAELKTAQTNYEASLKRPPAAGLPASESGPPSGQTSLIIDPPNGRFPALTDYGKQLQSKMNSTYKPGKDAEGSYDGIEDFGPWDRCITRGLPVSMEPRHYDNGVRITQSPGYVVITVEMAHEARIIPTTPLPKLDPAIKQWLGESRGHWDGNTLIVETTNFNGLTELTSAGVPGSPGPLQPSSPNMKTTERFTRISADTMNYSIKVEDPTILATGSFTVGYPMKLDNSYQVFEYACHEGNTAIRHYIEAARFTKAHPPAAPPAGAAPAGGRGGARGGGAGGGAPGGGGRGGGAGRGGAAAPGAPAAPAGR